MIKYIAVFTIVLVFCVHITYSKQNVSDSAEIQLAALRGEIDTINQDILVLLNKRAEVVLKIGELKKENSMAVYDPGREKEIENNLAEMNTGPMPDESVIKIFREIISASRNLQ